MGANSQDIANDFAAHILWYEKWWQVMLKLLLELTTIFINWLEQSRQKNDIFHELLLFKFTNYPNIYSCVTWKHALILFHRWKIVNKNNCYSYY
jgi:hypothetical protein